MASKHHVLIFPAGSEIGLEIFDSLKYSHHVELFGASGKSDHAAYVYDASRYVEDKFLYVDRPDFIDRLNRYLRQFQIEFIYPTHDTIAYFLAQHQTQLAAQVIGSSAQANRIARYKAETYRTFQTSDFCPLVYDLPAMNVDFPVFLKPNDGQGGKGTARADDKQDLDFYLRKSPGLLVTEYLPGEELSVDCFSDFKGELRFIGPRTRERVQMGISFRSTAIAVTEEIRHIAQTIHEKVNLNGAWFFQVKRGTSGRLKLLEFAPRQSSTMGLYRHTGVNFALLSLFNALKIPVQIQCNDYALQLDRCLRNRFKADLDYRRVYIDFDETIIAGSTVYSRVMDFLYQCRNRGIEIILITKHEHDLTQTLRDHAISERLFNQIIHLAHDQNKSEFMTPEDAIFIDNYWIDRSDVRAKLGIPVFDVDAIECLMR